MIVVALFIIALVATMSYVMMARLDRDINRTRLLLRNAQAEAYAQGSLAWAIDVLQSNAQNQRTKNSAIDAMPVKSKESIVNGFRISSTINDMQARYNLNNLSEPNEHELFMRLLNIVDPKLTQQQTKELTLAIADWIKSDSAQEELNKYYLNLPAPYRQAHRLMANPSELQLVKGMTPKLYTALQPYITALPMAKKINVQTAPAQILAALSPSMTMSAAQTIVQLRQQKPFTTLEDFKLHAIVSDKKIEDRYIEINSNYFLVETKVAIDQQKLVLYTMLERDNNDGKVKIMWQSKGIW